MGSRALMKIKYQDLHVKEAHMKSQSLNNKRSQRRISGFPRPSLNQWMPIVRSTRPLSNLPAKWKEYIAIKQQIATLIYHHSGNFSKKESHRKAQLKWPQSVMLPKTEEDPILLWSPTRGADYTLIAQCQILTRKRCQKMSWMFQESKTI